MMKRLVGVAIAGAVLTGGCSAAGGDRSPSEAPALQPLDPVSVAELTPASYAGLSLVSDSIVMSRSLLSETGGHLLVTSSDASVDKLLRPSPGLNCRYQDLLFPVTLGDERIAALGLCAKRGPGDRRSPDLYFLQTLDTSGRRRDVVRSPQPTPSLRLGPFAYDDRFGVLIGVGDALCGTIVQWMEDGFRPLEIEASSPTGVVLNLGTLYEEDECNGVGVAGWPQWLSDGGIAFIAAPDAAQRQSFARLDAPSYVFLARSGAAEARLSSPCAITHPRSFTILPGGRRAIVSGTLDGLGTGTWLLRLGTPGVMLMSRTAYGWLASNGHSVFGLEESADSHTSLVGYELPDILTWSACIPRTSD